jgi:hypothetical protein
MTLTSRNFLFVCALLLGCAGAASAQTGTIQFDAHIRAAAGIDEPVRQGTFYLLRKSYTDIESEARAMTPAPKMDEYIDTLDVSKEMKAWMKKNHCVHFSGEAFLKAIQPDDIIDVPELYNAYLDRMEGDQTVVFPTPKYKPQDKEKDPEKYAALLKEYKKQIKAFYVANPDSTQGMDMSLEDKDPGHKWDVLMAKNKTAVDRTTTTLSEGKYLAATAKTDLDGRGYFRQVPAGNYWLSSLNVESLAGEEHERWDTPVAVAASHETYVSLSNINAVQAASSTP